MCSHNSSYPHEILECNLPAMTGEDNAAVVVQESGEFFHSIQPYPSLPTYKGGVYERNLVKRIIEILCVVSLPVIW